MGTWCPHWSIRVLAHIFRFAKYLYTESIRRRHTHTAVARSASRWFHWILVSCLCSSSMLESIFCTAIVIVCVDCGVVVHGVRSFLTFFLCNFIYSSSYFFAFSNLFVFVWLFCRRKRMNCSITLADTSFAWKLSWMCRKFPVKSEFKLTLADGWRREVKEKREEKKQPWMPHQSENVSARTHSPVVVDVVRSIIVRLRWHSGN